MCTGLAAAMDAMSATDTLPESESPDSTARDCACCGLPLGKRHLRPRHSCGVCNRLVCAPCSPSIFQPAGNRPPVRACTRCASALEHLPSAKERLAQLETRLHALGDGPAENTLEMFLQSGKAHRPSISTCYSRELHNQTIDQSLSLVEAALGPVEEAREAAKIQVDQAEAVALLERQRREQIETKALEAKESVLQLGAHLREASVACEAVIEPLESVDHRHLGMEAWAEERVISEKRLQEAEASAAMALEKAATARDCLYRVAKSLHLLQHPLSGEALCELPSATGSAQDLSALCEKAVPAVREALALPVAVRHNTALSVCSSFGEPDALPRGLSQATVFTEGGSRKRSSLFGGYVETCIVCDAQLGKRHFNPRHHCHFCSSPVCGACSSIPRVCRPCSSAAQGFAQGSGEQLSRMGKLLESLKMLGGQKREAVKVELTSIDDILRQCEVALQPVKDMKAGSDVAKALADDVRTHLEASAQATVKANAELGSRLAALYGFKQPVVGKGPEPSSPSPGPAMSPHSPTDPSSVDFWATIPPRIVGGV